MTGRRWLPGGCGSADGQTVRVYFIDESGAKQILEGSVEEVTETAVVILHRPPRDSTKSVRIPYRKIQVIEILDKELNVRKTVAAVALGAAVVAVVVFIKILSSYDPYWF